MYSRFPWINEQELRTKISTTIIINNKYLLFILYHLFESIEPVINTLTLRLYHIREKDEDETITEGQQIRG